jgi:hypothetical protein
MNLGEHQATNLLIQANKQKSIMIEVTAELDRTRDQVGNLRDKVFTEVMLSPAFMNHVIYLRTVKCTVETCMYTDL